MLRLLSVPISVFLFFALACSDGDGDADSSVAVDAASDSNVTNDANDANDATLADSGAGGDAAPSDAASDVATIDTSAPMRLGAAAWIRREFADDPTMSGDFTRRTTVETPHLVDGATGCCSKYAFFVRNDEGPDDLRVGFIDVRIRDMMSTDAFGAGIGTSNSFPGVVMYLANVEIEPEWPNWEGYDTTNYDGIVLDGSDAVYAEGLTIRAYNADTAIDIKSDVAQFVDLRVEGPGHRALRYWGNGPHYLVDSQVENSGELGSGKLLWFRRCDEVSLLVYNSTFNGESEIPPGMYSCEDGTSPDITYLETDPRTTGEMHEMFSY